MEREDSRVRYIVSDRPISDEEWADGPPYLGDATAGSDVVFLLSPPMTIEEWEAEFCHGHDPRH
jgi:hypothetical protein